MTIEQEIAATKALANFYLEAGIDGTQPLQSRREARRMANTMINVLDELYATLAR